MQDESVETRVCVVRGAWRVVRGAWCVAVGGSWYQLVAVGGTRASYAHRTLVKRLHLRRVWSLPACCTA